MKIFTNVGVGMVVAVLLSGSVFAQDTDSTAQSKAPTASGKQAARAENRQISKAVRKALTSTKGLRSENIKVLVKGGAVTLAGSVPDEAQSQLAENAAKSVPQAHSVTNQLTLKEEGGH